MSGEPFTINRLTIIGRTRDAQVHYSVLESDRATVEFWVDLPHPRRIGKMQALRCSYSTTDGDADGWKYDINGFGPMLFLEGAVFDWDGGLGMAVSRLEEMPRLAAMDKDRQGDDAGGPELPSPPEKELE